MESGRIFFNPSVACHGNMFFLGKGDSLFRGNHFDFLDCLLMIDDDDDLVLYFSVSHSLTPFLHVFMTVEEDKKLAYYYYYFSWGFIIHRLESQKTD